MNLFTSQTTTTYIYGIQMTKGQLGVCVGNSKNARGRPQQRPKYKEHLIIVPTVYHFKSIPGLNAAFVCPK